MNATTKILIVDDEKNLRDTLAEILFEEGYSVETAQNGQEAITRCASEGFDVILMDVRMPGLDGVEAFRQIRRHHEAVRVIMMSAYGLDELKQTALEEGAIAFLQKPLDLDKVMRLVAEAKDTAILVVENDAQVATIFCQALKQQGYRVTLVRSPHEALELIEQIRFDIVFIDAQLPAMNGLDLYLQIKRVTPTTIAIMISDGDEEFEKIAREAVLRTAYTILRKPLELDQLLALLARISGQTASGALRKPPLDR